MDRVQGARAARHNARPLTSLLLTPPTFSLPCAAYLVVIQCQFGIMCCVSGLESAAARIPGAAFRTAVIGTPMWLVMRWLMSF